jgi:CelD/BcsL family acetyltransferase involved in cellulose biosynthesis
VDARAGASAGGPGLTVLLASRRHEVEVVDLSTMLREPGAADEWNALAARVPGASYFQTADWAASWWESVGGRRETRVARWRDADGSLRAVAALSRGRERLHRRVPVSVPVWGYTGTGPGEGDHGGPLADAADGELVGAVARWVLDASAPRALVAHSVAITGVRPPGAVAVTRTTCPVLALDGTAVGRSANFRSQLRRFARRLERDGVTAAWLPPGELDDTTLDALFRLHHRGRRARGLRTTLGEQHHRLLAGCAARASRECGPAAVVARDGECGEVVGVLVGFVLGGWFGAYQSGWDDAYAPHSIGSVLVARAITEMRDRGGHTFDFLRGTEDYKYRFGALDADDVTYVVGRGLGGRLLCAGAAVSAVTARR